MSWTSANDLKAQLLRLWERGELLRHWVTGEPLFPLRLRLKGPSPSELAGQFDAVRVWMAGLAAAPHLRIETREVNHRVQGLQRLPQSAWIDTLDDALALVGKRNEAARFKQLLELTKMAHPVLLEWLAKRPLRVIELEAHWPHLLDVVRWLQSHPRPGIYLRQVDIPGVHSKFIEMHRAVLLELLDLALPAPAIAAEHTGVGGFALRYGFLEKPARMRFRILDEQIQLLPGPTLPDVALDAESFAQLDVSVRHVFITENETNFLAFPRVPGAMVIFGAGYGWDALAKAEWLARRTIYYWGDIDTHGFAILDQLRGRFNLVESFLMDRQTLMAHESLWGEELEQVTHGLARLSASENALYDDLRDNRMREGVRLEQERVGFQWVQTALSNLRSG